MVELAAAKLAYDAIKSSKEMLGGLFDSRVDAEARPKVQAALDKLGDAQNAMFALRDELFRLQTENHKLATELASIEEWRSKATQYELAKSIGGAVVYRYLAEPTHFACPSCYERKQIHILQDIQSFGTYACPSCKAHFQVGTIGPVGEIGVVRTDYELF